MKFSHQQKQIIAHNPARNARVLAGPGTGKSTTAVALLSRLACERPELRFRMLTFTRCATHALAEKLAEAGYSSFIPTTIHSFALGTLVPYQSDAHLPLPIRLPDDWELHDLIHADLARRLRQRGFKKVDVDAVKELEQAMAARWESLNETAEPPASLDPVLIGQYVGLWETHRLIFGYTLAELPLRAGNAVEDYGIRGQAIDLLVVDEYQISTKQTSD